MSLTLQIFVLTVFEVDDDAAKITKRKHSIRDRENQAADENAEYQKAD